MTDAKDRKAEDGTRVDRFFSVAELKATNNGTVVTDARVRRDPKGDGSGFNKEGVEQLFKAMDNGQARPVF